MPQNPDKNRHDPPGRQHVAFQFEAGTSADVYIHVRPPGERTKKGITTHVIYESEEDQTYVALASQLTKAAGRIIEHNFPDGRDDIDTPDDVLHELFLLKTMVSSLIDQKGQTRTFELLRRAKSEVFQNEQTINRLTLGKRARLTETFRWHIEDAINNPVPVAHR